MAVEARSSGSGGRLCPLGLHREEAAKGSRGLFSQGLQSHSRGHTGSPPHTLPLGVRCQHGGWAADTHKVHRASRRPFPSLGVSFSRQCHLLKDKGGEQPRLTAGRKASPPPPLPRFRSAPGRKSFAFPSGLLTQPLFSVMGSKGRSSQGQQVHARGSSAQGPHPENEIWSKRAPAHR